MKAKTHSSPHRTKLLAAIHGAKRRLGLDDEVYRDMLERLTGKRSAGAMNERDLNEVLAHLNNSGNGAHYRVGRAVKAASGPNAALVGKIRALWISLWHLGAIEDRRDSALLAFAERQTGKQALEFLTPIECNKIIEALKDWCAREGVVWQANLGPGECVARAIWAKLAALGDVKIASPGALDALAQQAVGGPARMGFGQLTAAQQIFVTFRLARRLKQARRAGGNAPEAGDG